MLGSGGGGEGELRSSLQCGELTSTTLWFTRTPSTIGPTPSPDPLSLPSLDQTLGVLVCFSFVRGILGCVFDSPWLHLDWLCSYFPRGIITKFPVWRISSIRSFCLLDLWSVCTDMCNYLWTKVHLFSLILGSISFVILVIYNHNRVFRTNLMRARHVRMLFQINVSILFIYSVISDKCTPCSCYFAICYENARAVWMYLYK